MAKFTFKLEPMKKYRHQRLLIARKELIRAETKVADLRNDLRRAMLGRTDAITTAANFQGGSTSIASLHATLVESAGETIRRLEAQIREAEEELTRNREWAAQLGQELRVVEKLEEKQRAVFDAHERLKEKRIEDRWVAERWTRSGTPDPEPMEDGQ